MAVRTRVDLEGVENLQAALKRIPLEVGGEHLRAATAAGAEVVRKLASDLAPRSQDGSHGREAGFLSRNVRAEVQWTRRLDRADVFVGVSKDAYYGWFQETGTAYQSAQPFLRPAMDATKDDVIDEIRDVLAERILGIAEG